MLLLMRFFILISFKFASIVFSISSLIFIILSLFVCSKISVHALLSLLISLESSNRVFVPSPPKDSWATVLPLVKNSLPWFGVSTYISLKSLSGDDVSNLLDLLFLLFPTVLKLKRC